MKDYYKILEIQPDASLEVMNNAYRALVRKYHPDLYHTRFKASMTEKMQEINEAYNTLSTPASRTAYDRRIQHIKQPAPSASSPKFLWKSAMLWALGTFLFIKYLIKPFLWSPWGRLLLLGLVIYLAFRLLGRSKQKP